MDSKYTMARFSSVEALEDAIMADQGMDDVERAVRIFRLHQDEIRKCNVNLYYSLLAVADSCFKNKI